MRTALLAVALVSVAAFLGTGIGALLFGNFGEFQQRVMWSAVVGVVCALTGLLSTIRPSQPWMQHLLPVGLAMSSAALGLGLVVIWGPLEAGGVTWRAAATAAVVAVTVSHVALLATFPHRRTVVWALRSTAMLIAIGAGFLIIGALWGQVAAGENRTYYVWLAVALVLDAAGTLSLFLLSGSPGRPNTGGVSTGNIRSLIENRRPRRGQSGAGWQ